VRRRPSPARIWGRRLVALAALGAVGVALWLLLGGGEGAVPGIDDRRGAKVEELTIQSRAVGGDQPVTVVVPDTKAEHPPLLVFLHGRGGNEDSGQQQELFDALEAAGDDAPIVAFPDGGDSSYWHDRDSGDWGEYVTEEVIPEVQKRFDADADRIAIGGISMGGFGALDLARLHPGDFCAVGAHSPALWLEAGETAAGAFDDADDFAAHDVIAAAQSEPAPFTGQPMWLDAGDEDPFLAGDEAFVAALEDVGAPLESSFPPGGHDSDYWRSRWDDYMRFYVRALARCEG
jgi:S-formylglutathione hydrolase FrmB